MSLRRQTNEHHCPRRAAGAAAADRTDRRLPAVGGAVAAMSSPSWRQLAAIPETTEKRAILRALGIDPPSEGISRTFCFSSGERLTYVSGSAAEPAGMVYAKPYSCSRFLQLEEVPSLIRWPAGTPTGDALRIYLRCWGWLPWAERTPPDTTTKTII